MAFLLIPVFSFSFDALAPVPAGSRAKVKENSLLLQVYISFLPRSSCQPVHAFFATCKTVLLISALTLPCAINLPFFHVSLSCSLSECIPFPTAQALQRARTERTISAAITISASPPRVDLESGCGTAFKTLGGSNCVDVRFASSLFGGLGLGKESQNGGICFANLGTEKS